MTSFSLISGRRKIALRRLKMLRISGGKYRSRIIETPIEGTVPTKNRVREAMMNALQNDLPNGEVLDLFAGSGALGIEGLSRGAKCAVFVDQAPMAQRVIANNLTTLKAENATLLRCDALSALKKLAEEKRQFDVIFLDPPYAMLNLYLDSVRLITELGLLKEDGALVVEYEGDAPSDFAEYSRQRMYNYGRTHVLLLRK